MNQIRQLDLAADAFFSLTFKKNKTSAEQKKLEKVKKQFGGLDIVGGFSCFDSQ